MLELISDPDTFFQKDVSDDLMGATAVVGTAGVASALRAIILLYWTWGTITQASAFVTMTYIITIVLTAVGQFIFWFGFAVVFYVLTAVLDGNGSFRDLFTAIGWGFYPSILGGLLSAAAVVYRGWGVNFPNTASALGPFVQSLTSGPLFEFVSLVGISLLVWNAATWVFAVKHTRDVPLNRALTTVAIPVAIVIAWRLFNF